MIPEQRLSSTNITGALFNPWTRLDDVSRHWGPVALQDPSQGLAVRLWEARSDGSDILISAPGVAEIIWFTHTDAVKELSLAFNQNGDPAVAFVDDQSAVFLRWYDATVPGLVTTALSGDTVNPRVTLDDHRLFNVANSDVILGYVRAGLLRYRQQRDRFQVEYTPPIGPGGIAASATGLRHISMNSQMRLEFITAAAGDEDWALADVIEELAGRANVDPEKLGLAPKMYDQFVRGFTVTAAYPCYASLQSLSQVFFFDPSNADGKIRFVPRGADTVATVTEDDMIDDESEIESGETRRDSIGIPRVLHLNYYDVSGGLNTDKQSSERPEGTRAEGEVSLQTAVVLSADEAATVVAINHGLMVEAQKGELNFKLPDNYIGLTESDPIFVQYNGRTVRGIIAKVDVDDGEQAYKVQRDRQSLYGVIVEGVPAAPVTRPPSSVVGPTQIEILDTHILRDLEDMLGYHVALSGIYPAWPGAQVELSLDGGATYLDSSSTRTGVIMGSLTTGLADHPQAFPDTVNSVQVSISTPDALLESTTLAGMMSRRNLAIIGNELVNFADADEITEGVWEISHLLRGRKGTDTTAHMIGERFVLLDGVFFIPADLTLLNRSLTFRATTFGTAVVDATVKTVTFTGQSQAERQSAYLQARRDGANAVIEWQGVGRLGGGAQVAMGAHFIGYRLILTDGSVTQTFDQLAQALNTSLAAFTGPVTVSVQQRNNFTGLGPAIEAIV